MAPSVTQDDAGGDEADASEADSATDAADEQDTTNTGTSNTTTDAEDDTDEDDTDEGDTDNGDTDEGDVGGDVEDDVAPDVVDPCGCEDGEVCVTNDTVEDACFPRDCPEEQCDAGFVCVEDRCAAESCAGVDCGGYPNVCRGGVCQVGNCSDVDVFCPDGQVCLNDDCLTACDDQTDCTPLACVDGYCRPCGEDGDCGGDLICVSEQCVEPCTEDPDACEGGDVCDPESGRCVPACESDEACPPDELCDPVSGLCVPQECDEAMSGQCPDGELCVEGRCEPLRTRFAAGLCSGCGQMASSRYRATVVLSPVEMISTISASGSYRLESGTISVLRDE